MQIITLARAKELLGISDNSYDTELNISIPIVDNAVKLITNNRYNMQIIGNTTAGLQYMEVYSLYDGINYVFKKGYTQEYKHIEDLQEYLMVGSKLSGEGIAADTYIEDVYYNGQSVEFSGNTYTVPAVKITNAATATNSSAQIFIGANRGLEPIIAKAVWWQSQQINTTITDNSWKSKSMGPVSVTKGAGSDKIDNASGMPLWFVQALPRYMSGH